MYDIEYPEEVDGLLFALLGTKPLQAKAGKAWVSRDLYTELGSWILDMRGRILDSITEVRDSLPPNVADAYEQSLSQVVNRNGADAFQRFAQQMDLFADNQGKLSLQIQKAHFEIIAEIIALILELAILAAVSVFTGGASASEMILARMRARLAILMTVDRLLRYIQFFPSLTQAMEEAITSLAVQLTAMAINPPEQQAGGIDWKDVGISAAVGALAGFFVGQLGAGAFNLKSILSNVFRNNFGKDVFGKFEIQFKNIFNRHNANNAIFDVPSAFLAEGFGETIAVAIILGKWNWTDLVGAGLSGVSELFMHGPVAQSSGSLHTKVFPDGNVFTEFQKNTADILIKRLSEGPGNPSKVTSASGPKDLTPTPPATPPTTVGSSVPAAPYSPAPGAGNTPPPQVDPIDYDSSDTGSISSYEPSLFDGDANFSDTSSVTSYDSSTTGDTPDSFTTPKSPTVPDAVGNHVKSPDLLKDPNSLTTSPEFQNIASVLDTPGPIATPTGPDALKTPNLANNPSAVTGPSALNNPAALNTPLPKIPTVSQPDSELTNYGDLDSAENSTESLTGTPQNNTGSPNGMPTNTPASHPLPQQTPTGQPRLEQGSGEQETQAGPRTDTGPGDAAEPHPGDENTPHPGDSERTPGSGVPGAQSQDAVVRARGTYADALTAYADALRTVDELGGEVQPGTGTGNDTTVALADAQARAQQAHGQLLDAAARLRDLGIPPHAAGPNEHGHIPPQPQRNDAQREWIANQITPDDVPDVLAEDLLQLHGPGAAPSELDPLDHVRLLMAPPTPWPVAVDTVAANASLRLWDGAYADFKDAALNGDTHPEATPQPTTSHTTAPQTTAAEVDRSWDRAVALCCRWRRLPSWRLPLRRSPRTRRRYGRSRPPAEGAG
ncbi:putative serine/arginine repetitive matrix protein 1 [Streptomyces himastatinicus ATCC 53653]|uniref:Putative serine/arginine repetitive matrix protein 1 n=1 Tax=Streptomyces himastatinicus ATCC 53653 TaxID=457427 RepID=D9WJC5_9ACTN|nr:serine/arginine repetitive matrix protein 1 [Streptomyces himastatinicus]EFL29222.1 putative serine/arginine repetitive matrix protein 1 [Streptomyces himastatinicus ATCC 53653]